MSTSIQNSTPVETVKSFIDCIATKDLETMRKYIHPKATTCLIRDNRPQFTSLEESMRVLQDSPHNFAETTWDAVEHIDGIYAVVWQKFKMRRDGELLQLGSNSFSCWKSPDSGWVILTMSDIARTASEVLHE